ncbi:LOW QUALITY PROTEIN: Hypothetical protein PHPALM_36555 [Phytophthora palmivora]|uniref:Uncharacterized protein n=1 Tax=Phytophthora palmivora TaxID=4796 RepID=A0A2P4WZM4_9STRA|nr:LOW QUALITY PROTEIN: Hypothetical protein PHPALM_36555 [Phytophthora palmivora]
MRLLHVELLAVTAASLSNNKLAEDLRRQHLCEVCSAFAPPKVKGFESRFFAWHLHDRYIPLCNCVHREKTGNRLTSDQIWHDSWTNGPAIPDHLTKNIRFREHKRSDDE